MDISLKDMPQHEPSVPRMSRNDDLSWYKEFLTMNKCLKMSVPAQSEMWNIPTD